MTTVVWLWILHPVLVVVLVYPLLGVVVRLAWQTRQRRLAAVIHPVTVGSDHSDFGHWLAAAVVVILPVALTVVIATKTSPAEFAGGAVRAAQLLMVLVGTTASLVSLPRCKTASLRFAFSLITWTGVLSLGAQSEVWRLSDKPFSADFLQSHYWVGVAVTGLMLLSLAARPEILRDLRVRRLHISASVMAALLFLAQTIGSRDLLEIPLSWQKPAVYSCDFATRSCPVALVQDAS